MDFRYSTEHDDFRASLRGFLREAAPARAGARGRRGRRPRPAAVATAVRRTGAARPAPCRASTAARVAPWSRRPSSSRNSAGRSPRFRWRPRRSRSRRCCALGDEEQRARLLPGLLSGERIGALAAAGHDVTDAAAATVRADRIDGRTVLTGECAPVLHGHVADLFVVPAVADGVVVAARGGGRRPGSHASSACRRSTSPGRSPGCGSRRRPAEPLAAGSPDGYRAGAGHRSGAAGRRDARWRRGMPGDGGRICLQPKAVRPADRLVSGGEARLRRDDDRDRRDPGRGDVRRHERRRTPTNCGSPPRWPRRRPPTPSRCARARPSRSTAASPSPGSTTCTCTSAGPRPPRHCSAAAHTTAACSPTAWASRPSLERSQR